MKRILKSLCLLLVILSGFTFSSCSEDDAGKLLIVGTWRMDKIDYYLTEYGDTHEVKTLDLSNYSFVTKFFADGTFKYCALEINPDGMITEDNAFLEGTWNYSDGVITITSYGEEKYDIVKLDEINLVMQIVTEEKEIETVHKYIHYMTRLTEIFKES